MVKKLGKSDYKDLAADPVGTRDPSPAIEGVSVNETYNGLIAAGVSKCDLCGYWFYVADSELSDVCNDCNQSGDCD